MNFDRLPFRLEAEAAGSRARAGTFQTLHGPVQTPLFMPVGTQATVKAQLPETLEAAGSQILLANTYHLLLRPGPEVFRRLGGIHGLTSWNRGVLTDSGGFQIFSLPHSRSMTEEGAVFQSYLDGRSILLSPELSIETQRAIGSDIMMVLDQCVASTAPEEVARRAMELTQRWAGRSLAARGDSRQALFAIVQGALFPELRRESALRLMELPFEGFAIGGLAVGEAREQREEICAMTAALLPRDRPRYLMGVGTPIDILEAVHRGVDMFDCIIPTQLAQRGGVFTSRGTMQLRRGVYKFSEEKLDPACACPTCARYSLAYLHHLTKTGETLGWQLLGQHNIWFYHRLMRDMRASILGGRFLEFYKAQRAILDEPDPEHPAVPSKPKRQRHTKLGEYAVHVAHEGFGSILHVASGEIMHSRTPPMEEARNLYVNQCGLRERLRPADASPLTVWDAGLGAAANAMAAILCYEELAATEPVRPMKIISFENDLDSLKLAFMRRDLFTYLRHPAPDALLAEGRWQSKTLPGLSWELMLGDFLQTIAEASAPPDVIFYDMFSSKTSGTLWTAEAFRKLHAVCGERAVELYTYTCATASRSAMLAAGFHVARGNSAGVKSETTIAMTAAARRASDREFLDREWLAKWERSTARLPFALSPAETPEVERAIRNHPQFAAVSPCST
ncbi:MAG TPA: tRNA guanosine(34) transglycosylase Tgt [Chthoniobacteraceae bacterium]|jgi:queuine tRNA-ribosyltransferase|nr:tRNA guanosine(34) transglycosylase Tgt [Chthoniobacteraceae bacterium]